MAFTTLKQKKLENDVLREVRFSDSGIVAVVDTLPDGTFRHTRIGRGGSHVQVIESTDRKAWLAARKAAA